MKRGVDCTPSVGSGAGSGVTVINHLSPEVVIVCNRAGEIYRSPDSGDDWSMTTMSGRSFQAIHSRGNRVIVVGNGGTIFRSTDGGVSWTFVSMVPTTATLYSVWMQSQSRIFAVGTGGTILVSSDGGISWTNQTSGTTNTLTSVHFSGRNGFAVGESGTVLHTTDNGDHWEPISGITADVDCVLMLKPTDVVMFSRTGSATTKWTWSGGSLTNAGAGPTVTYDRLRIAEILCKTGTNLKYVTQPNGGIFSCSVNVTYICSNSPTTVSDTAQHVNRDGSLTPYTISSYDFGNISVTDFDVTTDNDHGNSRPCLRAHIEWNQTQCVNGFVTTEPLFGAAVLLKLHGGPQVSLTPGEWFNGPSLQAVAKRVAVSSFNDSGRAARCTLDPFQLATTTTFTLTVIKDGVSATTSALAWNASLSSVAAALNALSTVSGNAVVTGFRLDQTASGSMFIEFSDTATRTITGSFGVTLGLIESHSYSVHPVVFRGTQVFGVGPAIYNTPRPNGVEACWRYISTGPICSGGTDTGSYNRGLHSRYREFLEKPDQLPNGLEGGLANGGCMRYCRNEDNFGDWSIATVETAHAVPPASAPSYAVSTWIPETTDFSSGDFTIGFAIAFYSMTAGSRSMDLLIDNICLDWSVREPLPTCSGLTQVINESGSAIPSGWESGECRYDTDTQEDLAGFGSIRVLNGAWTKDFVLVDNESGAPTPIPFDDYTGNWRERRYNGGVFFKPLGVAVTDCRTNDFCLIVECDVDVTHEEDREWWADDEPNTIANPTSLNLNLIRPFSHFGIFIHGLARFGVVRAGLPMHLEAYGENITNVCDLNYYDLVVSHNVDFGSYTDANLVLNEPTYLCESITPGEFHTVPKGDHRHQTRGEWYLNAAAIPLRTDKLRMLVKWSGLAATQFDCSAENRFHVRAWLNDQDTLHMDWRNLNNQTGIRDVTGNPYGPLAGNGPIPSVWWNPGYELAVGIYSIAGGRWRNLKCWLKT